MRNFQACGLYLRHTKFSNDSVRSYPQFWHKYRTNLCVMKCSIPVSWLLQRSKYGEIPSAKWAEKFSATSLKAMSLYMA
ncbi:hypothetical protein AALK14_04935 [Butyricimonas hominis]|uniref:hypothetical protein n=1 Tax=Butyricimonas hominis TaxID=2763032 RepID=UPI0035196D55